MPDLSFYHWVLISLVVLLAVSFDFINGFHDTANAIATVVSTRVLSPGKAILMAAGLNFLGALTGQAVAKTITGGLVEPGAVKVLDFSSAQVLVMAALIGAIIWNLITWYFGIPSSSSHALIGGVVGAGVAAVGVGNVVWSGLVNKVVLPLVVSPIAGFIVSLLLMRLLYFLVAKASPRRVGGMFRRLQLVSSAFMAFSHGSNDAQKTMGVITLALFSAGFPLAVDAKGTPNIPWEVVLIAAVAMAAGTAAGGRRIIHTMGQRLAHLEPIHGFAAETTAATIIETASRLGFPLSTTHVISSCILGVGAARRVSGVRWAVAFNMIRAWIYTIPVCASIAFVVYLVFHLIFREG
ncbi:MAG: inorganic phosphate transporter, PiT family [Chloroflexia bacterium]|jgi:PiT family inorganic phosphate transporter|nr:inorganic phosphate transporter, PiT family [Chloroflexia bacterium]